MTLHVGINGRTFSTREPGGAVQASISLSNSISSLPSIDATFFGHRSIKRHVHGNVKDHLMISESPAFGILWEKTILPRSAASCDLDILFSTNGNGPLWNSDSYQTVMCIHDINAQKGQSSWLHQLYRKSMVPRAARLSDHIITVSEFSKKEISNTLNIDPSKISVVYNGLDPLFLSDVPGTKVDVPSKYILYVGAKNPRKNISGILRLYEKLTKEYDLDHKLVMAGPSNKNIFKSISIPEDNIIDLGFVSKKELKYLYSNASLFLYPSFYEGFGLPPLEAMASGTAVLSSRTSSLPEVLGSGAILVDPTDIDLLASEAACILEDDSKRNSLEKKGLDHAKKYTWENAAQNLRSIFEKLIHNS